MSYTTIATLVISLLTMTLLVKNVVLLSINNQTKTQKVFILLADLAAFSHALYFYLLATKRIFYAPNLLYFGGFSLALYSIFPVIYLLFTTKPLKKKIYTICLSSIISTLLVANVFLNEIDFIKRIDLVYLSTPSIKSIALLMLQTFLTIITSILGLTIIKRTHSKAEQVHSSIQKFQFSWLSIQFRSLIAVSIIAGIVFGLFDQFLFSHEYQKQVLTMILIYSVVLITTLGCVKQAPITEEEILISNEIEEFISKEDSKPVYSSDDLEEYEKIVNSVVSKISSENLYLDADLKLNSLSKICKIPSYQISKSINFILNKNFNEFINDFRIIESKRKLSSKEFENITILAIALESGFNSKSSFNAQFKRRENITPNEYRSLNSSN